MSVRYQSAVNHVVTLLEGATFKFESLRARALTVVVAAENENEDRQILDLFLANIWILKTWSTVNK